MRSRRRIVLAFAALLVAMAVSAAARAQSPPYAGDMERLAEILGSLQFLTELCDGAPGPWRDEMEALMTLAQPDEAWRARLTDRFNLGYASFAAVYRQCTAAARLAISTYRTEGAELAGGIVARFGGAAAPVLAPSG